ncbi:hypothetical protein QIA37_05150 (plasmid) [Borrelia sp. CA_690]|nr:hypothetical protein [Borrelia maritima]
MSYNKGGNVKDRGCFNNKNNKERMK